MKSRGQVERLPDQEHHVLAIRGKIAGMSLCSGRLIDTADFK